MCPQQFFGKRKHYCKVIFLLLMANCWSTWSCCKAGPWGMQLSLSGGGEGGHQKVGTFVVNSGEGRTCHCPHEPPPVPTGGSRILPAKTWGALPPSLGFSGLQQIGLPSASSAWEEGWEWARPKWRSPQNTVSTSYYPTMVLIKNCKIYSYIFRKPITKIVS